MKSVALKINNLIISTIWVFLIAQDDDNDVLNQNFKLVDWNKIIN